jgi:quinol monooxygenase YgiN
MENARASVENEAGWYRFGILQDQDQDQEQAKRFYLYEIYENKQALAVHKIIEHYLQRRKPLADIVVA